MKPAVWRRLARAQTRLVGEALAAGVDEAGRGPLAGPVVAAAVVLAPGGKWNGLDDSKKVDAARREALFARVLVEARAFSWTVIGPRAIDHANILRASLRAMLRSVEKLSVTPDVVLVDGRDEIPGLGIRQLAIIDGDARMLSIAAASIVAKVVRDRIMERLDTVYPAYGFARHKGYATADHLAALARLGPCALHRFSYTPVCTQELPFDAPAAEPESVAVLVD